MQREGGSDEAIEPLLWTNVKCQIPFREESLKIIVLLYIHQDV